MRRRRFDDVKPETQKQMLKAAAGVAHHLTRSNEPWAKQIFNPDVLYQMRIGDDSRNMDVRDLLVYSNTGIELGISLKWNSNEIKSLRLGDNWFKQFHIPDTGEWQSAVSAHHKTLSHSSFGETPLLT